MIEVNTENYTVQGLVRYARAIASDASRRTNDRIAEDKFADILNLLTQALNKMEGDRDEKQ